MNYWTMSPYEFNANEARVFIVGSNGNIYGSSVLGLNLAVAYGVRPVINLRSDVTLLGSGTSDDPYTVI